METQVAPKPTTSIFGSDATQRILAFGGLIVLFVAFSIASPFFRTTNNLMGILLATAVNAVLALGVTFVIISGGIDLSVGTVMTLSAVMAGVFITFWGLPVPLGVLAGLATGAMCGLLNGTFIARMRIPPFIATLGMMYIAKGLSLVISGLAPIYFNDAPTLQPDRHGIGRRTDVSGFPGAQRRADHVRGGHRGRVDPQPHGAGALLLCHRQQRRSDAAFRRQRGRCGRRLIYGLCGLYAGLGGILMASRLNSAQPALGAGYELDAIAAVVIGGTSLSGGEGSILGTVIGAFVISTLSNGLRIMSVPQEWQIVVTGAIVIGAVYLDMMRRGRE